MLNIFEEILEKRLIQTIGHGGGHRNHKVVSEKEES